MQKLLIRMFVILGVLISCAACTGAAPPTTAPATQAVPTIPTIIPPTDTAMPLPTKTALTETPDEAFWHFGGDD
jgi:hypothetical protein